MIQKFHSWAYIYSGKTVKIKKYSKRYCREQWGHRRREKTCGHRGGRTGWDKLRE